MAGIMGIAQKAETDCAPDLFLGTFYLQHRAQNYCGISVYGKDFDGNTHRGLIRPQFGKEVVHNLRGNYGIAAVSNNRQPLSELSQTGGHSICYDGNFVNAEAIKTQLLKRNECFSGYHHPKDINDTTLLSRIISQETDFVRGIEKLTETMVGDFAVVCLRKEGVYAARGWGRKPLILGEKENCYAVSSESNSFENTNFKILRDVHPGEVVLLDAQGIHSLKKIELSPIKFGTFEWIYTAYPPSVIDERSVAEVRIKLGQALAKRFPIKADIVSPFPNSGRWHALGYSQGSGIPYLEAFVRYDYSDRSYTPSEQDARDLEARTKLIPVEKVIKGKRLILVDDSIVRGTQTLNQVKRLRELGAKEIHLRIACPPLMSACKYGKSTKKNEDCIARRMPIEEIKSKLEVNSLGYATAEDLELAIGYPKANLCLECWAV